MKQLRLLLIVGNTLAVAVLVLIPVGKLLGVLHEEVDTAAIIGWFIFFIPATASLLALWGVQFSRPALSRPFVATALVGSVLLMLLSALMSRSLFLASRPDIAPIGMGATILFGLNVLTLWTPFRERLESSG
jgi:hypothetical protein